MMKSSPYSLTTQSERQAQLAILHTAFIPWLATINPQSDKPMRRTALLSDLPQESQTLINALVDKRLLLIDMRDGEATIEVAHEALLRRWEVLAQWLHAEREDLKLADAVEHAAQDWNKAGRKDGWLIVGERLSIATTLTCKPGFKEKLRIYKEFLEASHLKGERLRIAAESSEAIMITDANANILSVNQAFQNITDYSSDDVLNKHTRILSSEKHDKQFFADMWQELLSVGTWTGEISSKRKNGEIYPKQMTITAVKNELGETIEYVAQFRDISSIKKKMAALEYLALHDLLSNLPNRVLLYDRLDRAVATSAHTHTCAALFFIDLDNFRIVNDTKGYNVGDLLLVEVAKRLQACIRESDTLARLGGDEFVVFLQGLDEDETLAAVQARGVGKKILEVINQPYMLNDNEHHSSSCIGITLVANSKHTADDFLKQADIAMYEAKKSGRNTLRFFDPAMQENIDSRTYLESNLHYALERQQFQLHYQIQVDSLHRPFGAEALIRWMIPGSGVVFPEQFIPLAEEMGLILPIGQWVLETACAQIKAWQQDALARDLVICVNVSAKQFHQAEFVAHVQAAVQHYAIDPKLLKLELTNSMLLENIDDIIETMNALNKIGIRLSLDNFGTDYSSLQYLKRLPLDQINIDQMFVRDIATDNSDRVIVRAIIAMAQNLNLDVIAEGLETEEQRQILLSNGCTRYQGYLFGEPLPIDEFGALLQQVPLGAKAQIQIRSA